MNEDKPWQDYRFISHTLHRQRSCSHKARHDICESRNECVWASVCLMRWKKKEKKEEKKNEAKKPSPSWKDSLSIESRTGRGTIVTICLTKWKPYAICIYTYPRIATHKPGYRDRAFSTQMAMGYTHLGCSLNYCTLFDANRKGVRRVMF